MLIKYALIIA